MGLFDMQGLDLNAILGSTDATQGESTLDRLLRAKQAEPGVTPPVPAQGFDASQAIVPPPVVPGVPPVQGFGGDVMPPVQGFEGPAAAPPTGIRNTQTMPMAQALDVPDNIAKTAAAKGVPPPKMDLPSWASMDPSVGAALTGNPGIPMPRGRPTDLSAQAKAPGAPMDITSEAQKAGGAAKPDGADKMGEIAKALRGVTMPKNPELQKISSPSAPRATGSIKGGDLMMLLQALNAGPGVGGGLKLPSTLGQALGK